MSAEAVALEALRLAAELLRSAPVYIQYATSGFATTNLETAGGSACTAILPLADGTIVVVQPDGTSRTLSVLSGVMLPIRASTLTSTTANVIVLWNES